MPKASKSARVSTTEEEREEVAKLFAVPLFDEEIKPEELKVVCDNHLGVSKHLKISIIVIKILHNYYHHHHYYSFPTAALQEAEAPRSRLGHH